MRQVYVLTRGNPRSLPGTLPCQGLGVKGAPCSKSWHNLTQKTLLAQIQIVQIVQIVPHQSKLDQTLRFKKCSSLQDVKSIKKSFADFEWTFFTNLQIICQNEASCDFDRMK